MAKNRKIKNATQNTLNNIEFKSRLEAVIYKSLKESGFEPQYESTKYIIWEGFYPTIPFYNKDSKTGLLKLDDKKLINITYTPDFSFTYNNLFIIIEVKGMENHVFPLKKKLFRKYLETWKIPVLYFEIYNKKQLMQAIEIIKNYEKD